jgi:hypothetical protein
MGSKPHRSQRSKELIIVGNFRQKKPTLQGVVLRNFLFVQHLLAAGASTLSATRHLICL